MPSVPPAPPFMSRVPGMRLSPPPAGFYFLYYLQQLVGGPQAFEPFMRHYLRRFAFGTVDSGQFRQAFEEFFADNPQGATHDALYCTVVICMGMPRAPPDLGTVCIA